MTKRYQGKRARHAPEPGAEQESYKVVISPGVERPAAIGCEAETIRGVLTVGEGPATHRPTMEHGAANVVSRRP